MRSTAYTVGYGGNTLEIAGANNELFVIRLGLLYEGKIKGGDPVPKTNSVLPFCWMVGTDRNAIKKEICQRVDDIFNSLERKELENDT